MSEEEEIAFIDQLLMDTPEIHQRVTDRLRGSQAYQQYVSTPVQGQNATTTTAIGTLYPGTSGTAGQLMYNGSGQIQWIPWETTTTPQVERIMPRSPSEQQRRTQAQWEEDLVKWLKKDVTPKSVYEKPKFNFITSLKIIK
jgi:hypothetical protein